MAKNRDALPDAGASTLAASSNPLVASLFATSVAVERKGARAARRGNRRKVRRQGLRQVPAGAHSDGGEYEAPIRRCVKPNADQAPASWRGALVLEQLRYMGLLQVVEARRRGYPRPVLSVKPFERFGKLCDMTHSPNREGAVCLVDALASSLSLDRDAIVVESYESVPRARPKLSVRVLVIKPCASRPSRSWKRPSRWRTWMLSKRPWPSPPVAAGWVHCSIGAVESRRSEVQEAHHQASKK